jgi:hypothetical protein
MQTDKVMVERCFWFQSASPLWTVPTEKYFRAKACQRHGTITFHPAPSCTPVCATGCDLVLLLLLLRCFLFLSSLLLLLFKHHQGLDFPDLCLESEYTCEIHEDCIPPATRTCCLHTVRQDHSAVNKPRFNFSLGASRLGIGWCRQAPATASELEDRRTAIANAGLSFDLPVQDTGERIGGINAGVMVIHQLEGTWHIHENFQAKTPGTWRRFFPKVFSSHARLKGYLADGEMREFCKAIETFYQQRLLMQMEAAAFTHHIRSWRFFVQKSSWKGAFYLWPVSLSSKDIIHWQPCTHAVAASCFLQMWVH